MEMVAEMLGLGVRTLVEKIRKIRRSHNKAMIEQLEAALYQLEPDKEIGFWKHIKGELPEEVKEMIFYKNAEKAYLST